MRASSGRSHKPCSNRLPVRSGLRARAATPAMFAAAFLSLTMERSARRCSAAGSDGLQILTPSRTRLRQTAAVHGDRLARKLGTTIRRQKRSAMLTCPPLARRATLRSAACCITLAVSRTQRLGAARHTITSAPCGAKLLRVGLDQPVRAHYPNSRNRAATKQPPASTNQSHTISPGEPRPCWRCHHWRRSCSDTATPATDSPRSLASTSYGAL
jgi:hypothetical protein